MPPRPGGHRGRDLVGLAVVLLVWIGVWIPRFQGPIDLRWDASVHYVLGTSLAEGQGYRLLNEPGRIEAIQYPPVLPLLVAAHERLLGTSDYLVVAPRLRLTYLVLSGLYLLGAYALVRPFVGPALAAAVSVMTALSYDAFLHPSDSLYAEIPFALVATAFLLCHRKSHQRAFAAATGMLGATAFLLRTAGIALLAAWVAESLLGRRFRQAALRTAVAAVPVLLWQAHVWHVTASPEYREPAYPYQRAAYAYSNVSYLENSWLVDPFRPELGRTSPHDLPRRVLRNLGEVPRSLGESVWVAPEALEWLQSKLHRSLGSPRLPPSLLSAPVLVIGWCVLAGAAILAARWLRPRTARTGSRAAPEAAPARLLHEPSGGTILVLYYAFTIAMIVLTPWPEQFWRYLAPLAPLSGLFLMTVLLSLGERFSRRGVPRRRAFAFVVAAPVVAFLVLQAMVAYSFLDALEPVSYHDARGRERRYSLLEYGPVWQKLEPAMEWVRRHAGPDDVVASTVPHLAYLRTGRRAVLPPMEIDPGRARRLLAAVPVRYVLVDELGVPGISERYAAPAVRGRPGEWRLVYAAPGGGAEVYERLR